jgi:sulfite exporter TauE/SafE
MISPEYLPVLITGFLGGLLGSGHCFGMCGGIAGTFGALAGSASPRSRWLPGILFNFGRLISYIVIGVIAALVLSGAGQMLQVPYWTRILRLITAGMIFLIGLRFLFEFRFLDQIEKAGAGLWRHVQPIAVRLSARPGIGSRLLLGICWGFLPCGLVYSFALTAASTGQALAAGGVMLAFGLGTLPSMLGVTWMSPVLGSMIKDPVVRRIIGLSLVALAVWTILMMGPGMITGHRMH